MVSNNKHLVAVRKNAIDLALGSLEHRTSICSKGTPSAVKSVIDALGNAIEDDTLYAEEINSYKKRLSDSIAKFEGDCDCFHIVIPKDNKRETRKSFEKQWDR